MIEGEMHIEEAPVERDIIGDQETRESGQIEPEKAVYPQIRPETTPVVEPEK